MIKLLAFKVKKEHVAVSWENFYKKQHFMLFWTLVFFLIRFVARLNFIE